MGTDAWRNWRAYEAGNVELENVDEDLHSDRQFVGGPVLLGPYRLSVVMRAGLPTRTPRVGSALRLHLSVREHLAPEVVVDGKLAKPNSDSYHGGSTTDEIAALASLVLGVRLRVGGTAQMSLIHETGVSRDPVFLEVPPLAHPGVPGQEYVPAAVSRPTDLEGLARVQTFPMLAEADQIALVKAARAYATGLWWANEDPNQAWLQFVAAAETAANQRQDAAVDPIHLVQRLWPELWSALESSPDESKQAVCQVVSPQMRATRKFIDFLVECSPQPLPLRPAAGVVDWQRMGDHARRIYGYRSAYLHGAKPFPLPMLELPRMEENGAIQEVPYGLNSGGLGGVWEAAESPMLLSTFEHVVRGALLRWWDELDASSASPDRPAAFPSPTDAEAVVD